MFNLPKTMMVRCYTTIIKSVLTFSITIWYAAATAKHKGRPQRIIRSTGKVIDYNLSPLCIYRTLTREDSKKLRQAAGTLQGCKTSAT